MKYHYSKGWFRAKKKSLEAYPEEKAKKLHIAKKLYCVLAGEKESPSAFIEINNDFYGVSFLDKLLRNNLSYQFVLQENGKLFLQMANYREYKGETDEVIEGTSYIFKPSGSVKIIKEDFVKNEKLESESEIDVNSNWEEIPKFGAYDKLLKIERNNS